MLAFVITKIKTRLGSWVFCDTLPYSARWNQRRNASMVSWCVTKNIRRESNDVFGYTFDRFVWGFHLLGSQHQTKHNSQFWGRDPDNVEQRLHFVFQSSTLCASFLLSRKLRVFQQTWTHTYCSLIHSYLRPRQERTLSWYKLHGGLPW